jgi:hypothetical protein
MLQPATKEAVCDLWRPFRLLLWKGVSDLITRHSQNWRLGATTRQLV